MHKSIFILIIVVLSICTLLGQTSTINYSYSNDDFVNPERGFYKYSETSSSSYTLLDSADLAGYRTLQPASDNATYSVYTSLIFRYFILESFKSILISNDYLQKMEIDFNVARKAGVKLIPRFVYTKTPTTGNCGSWICPPYGDAPKNIILSHINQLKPILVKNKDVIASVQMGFIGTWGENFYTDYFGDTSLPPYALTSQNWSDRKEVLDSLLSAVPSDLHIQVRYPQMKQKYVYGVNAPLNSLPSIMAEAHNQKINLIFHQMKQVN